MFQYRADAKEQSQVFETETSKTASNQLFGRNLKDVVDRGNKPSEEKKLCATEALRCLKYVRNRRAVVYVVRSLNEEAFLSASRVEIVRVRNMRSAECKRISLEAYTG